MPASHAPAAGQFIAGLLPERRVGLLNAHDGVVHVRRGGLARGVGVTGLDGLAQSRHVRRAPDAQSQLAGLRWRASRAWRPARTGPGIAACRSERVARRLGNGQVVQHVFVHPVTTGQHRLVQIGNRLVNVFDISLGAALCGQRRPPRLPARGALQPSGSRLAWMPPIWPRNSAGKSQFP